MSLDPKRLAAVFFIPHQRTKASLMELLEKADATQISPATDNTQMVDCVWAGWNCKGYAEDLSDYRVLYIYFWQSDFLANLGDNIKPIEQDGLYKLVKTFESTCTKLVPEVAFIITHLWQANIDFVRNRERMIRTKDTEGLLSEYFGALYIEDEICKFITRDLQNRDTLKTNSGVIIFAGKDDSRWF